MSTDQRPQLLTHAQCSALRGLAIIGIFMHNYCHWLGFAVKENEYTFNISNIRGIMSAMASPDINLPIHLLSFFGHYGVPVFLFLSAYGLVMKYERCTNTVTDSPTESVKNSPPKAHLPHAAAEWAKDSWQFIRTHYLKLFKMMIVGFVTFTMIDAVTPGRHHYTVTDVLAQMFMFNNLLPSPDRIIWPGPYWFFGLMLQLYIVYKLMLCRRGWKTATAAIIICWIIQAVCQPDGETLNRIRYNFIGGMLPFGAGLLFARYGKPLSRTCWSIIAIIALTAVVLSGMHFHTWLWTPLMVCVAAVGTAKILPQGTTERLAWLGNISAALFVMHPVTRKIFIPISRQGDVYTGLLLYIIASVALAWVARELIKRIKIG